MSGRGGTQDNSGRKVRPPVPFPDTDTVQTLQRRPAGKPVDPNNSGEIFDPEGSSENRPSGSWRELTQTTHGTPEGHSVNLDELRDRNGNLIEGSGYIICNGETIRRGDFETTRRLLEQFNKGEGTNEYEKATEELGKLCPGTPQSLAPPASKGRYS